MVTSSTWLGAGTGLGSADDAPEAVEDGWATRFALAVDEAGDEPPKLGESRHATRVVLTNSTTMTVRALPSR